MTPARRVGVLVSGRGSNLQALLDARAEGWLGAELAVVISNRPRAAALDRARAAGVPALAISHRRFAGREPFEEALAAALHEHGVDLVVLAGFMRILTGRFLSAFPGRVINVHPSLLPAFPGVAAQRQALEYGVAVAGCTVHFVDEGTDSGPVIAQAAVPVLPDDDEARLAARILAQEHRLLPRVVAALAAGRVQRVGRRVRVRGGPVDPTAHLASPLLDGGGAVAGRDLALDKDDGGA